MKAHRTDTVSLFFGLIFVVLAASVMASTLLDLQLPGFGWWLAGGLVVFGVLGVASALTPARKPREAEPMLTGAVPHDNTGTQDL